jgi:hypothetical protein
MEVEHTRAETVLDTNTVNETIKKSRKIQFLPILATFYKVKITF